MGLSSKQVSDDQQLFDNWSFQEPPPKLPTTVKRQQNHHQNQLPAAALNCPRCDSSSTKFCYYNNYNKSQPRHFCKSCKRHWTNGGTLRNVPIGGGRKNKRHKPSSQTTTAPSNNNNNNKQIIMSSRASQSAGLCLYNSADDSNLVYQAMSSTNTHHIDHSRQSSVILDVENVMNYLPSTVNEFSWSSNSMTRSSNCMNIGTSEGGMIGDDVCWELKPSSSTYWNWNVGFDDDDDHHHHATLMWGGSAEGGGFNNVVLSNWDEMDQMVKP